MGAHRGDDSENLSKRSKEHKAKHADKDRQPTGRGDYVDGQPDSHFDFESDRETGNNDPHTR